MSTSSRDGPDPTRARLERDIDDELAFHRERMKADLVARGLSAVEAETETARRFDRLQGHRDRLVQLGLRQEVLGRRRAAMEVMKSSWRSLIRDVKRSPGFVLGLVAILTIGLGVNAITYSLVDRLVLSGPSGVHAPEELRRVVLHRANRSGAQVATTDLAYLDYRDLLQARQLQGAAAESATPLLFGSGAGAERIQGLLVTATYFPLLGATPAAGRFFTAAESEQEGLRAVVLSHAFWQRRFGGDSSVIGQVWPIESNRYLVIGVAPRHFTGTRVRRVDVFLPLEAAADEQIAGRWQSSRNISWLEVIVRLRSDVGAQAAAEEATTLHRQGRASLPAADADARLELAPLSALRGATASPELGVAALVGGVALVVLLIAFANAANLFLARALRRQDQVAIRIALGGGRRRLVLEEGLEGALLATGAALVALSVAVLGARPVQTWLFPDVAWLEVPVDGRLLIGLLSFAVLGGVAAAGLPMLQVGRTDVQGWLRGGSLRMSRSRTRTQTAILVAQGALSVLLLIGAGLFVRSLAHAQGLDLGIDAGRLLVVGTLPGETPPPPEFDALLRASLDKIPGVERTTVAAGTTSFVSSWAIRLNVPGLAEKPRVEDGGPYVHAVAPGYFAVVGTSIEEGRAFTSEDREGAPRVVIVNRTMARLYWPGQSAIGKCLTLGSDESPPCSTVVGIAENARRQEIVEGESLLYYIPIEQAPENLRAGRLIVRAVDDDPNTLARIAETVRREALRLDPALRYVAARPLADVIAPQLRAWTLGAGLFSVFGVLALLVAAVGLYSVVSFDVEGRRRELGVRAALGATRATILRMVLGDALRLAAAGVVIGLALAWLLAPAIETLLYGVPPHDPGVFATVAISLFAAAVVASLLPGIRASRADPSRSLRAE